MSVESMLGLEIQLANKMKFVEDGTNCLHSIHLLEQTETNWMEEPK